MDFILNSLEHGLVFGILVFGVFITYRILDFPDLTVDGSFPLGAAVSARLIFEGWNPIATLIVAFVAGSLAGLCTGILHTKFKITNLLTGILMMIALYSINLRVMGRANIPLLAKPTIFRQFQHWISLPYSNLVLLILITFSVKICLDLLFQTRLGLTIRATGNNAQLVTNLGINPGGMILIGLSLANGLVALSGALVAQMQGFADVGMGIGTIVTGLASVIIGQAIFKGRRFIQITTSVLLGSIFYRAAIRGALTLGLAPTDLKLATALLIILALTLPQTRFTKFGQLNQRGGYEC